MSEHSKGFTMPKHSLGALILRAGKALPAAILMLSLGAVRGQEQDRHMEIGTRKDLTVSVVKCVPISVLRIH
jgi:hypothetical protein